MHSWSQVRSHSFGDLRRPADISSGYRDRPCTFSGKDHDFICICIAEHLPVNSRESPSIICYRSAYYGIRDQLCFAWTIITFKACELRHEDRIRIHTQGA